MKKIILFVLLTILFPRCEEVKENFNYVVVTVTGIVTFSITDAGNSTSYISGQPIEMSLIKAGGERINEVGVTGKDGRTSITGVFNVYKEQPVEFKAKSVNYPSHYNSCKTSWDFIDMNAENNETGPRTFSTKRYFYFELSPGEFEDN